jgi:hypothetical protein
MGLDAPAASETIGSMFVTTWQKTQIVIGLAIPVPIFGLIFFLITNLTARTMTTSHD